MPVRIVPKNYRNLTGLVPNSRTQAMTAFESTLERDFLLLLDFDPDVAFYEEQPLTITYYDETGRRRTYTPDVLVRYRTACVEVGRSKAHLCEVKYRDDLRQHWTDYRPKFRAAQRYARQQGWRFRVVTERHVRTPSLANVKFLGPYRMMHVDDAHQAQLLRALRGEGDGSGKSLAPLSADRWRQAQLLPTLWQLIARRQVGADFAQPLTMRSQIWLKEPR